MSAILLLIVPAQALCAELKPLDDTGQADYQFRLSDIRDRSHALSDYTGRVVLVNFWASWCPPCIYEMPQLQKLQAHLASRPFTVITINVGEKKYKVRKFTRLIDLDLPVLLDTTKDTFASWGVQTLPTSFLVDKAGGIRYHVRGDPGWQEQQTLEIIESLINEQP